MRHAFGVLILLAAAFLGGCAAYYTPGGCHGALDMIGCNHKAGDQLIKMAQGQLTDGKTIITASFVNLDNLSDSSSFGRLAANQVATRFVAQGYTVVELLLRKDVAVKKEKGEFLLSREVQKIGAGCSAQAALVGTYAAAEKYIYVTAKLIDTVTGNSMASCDYAVPINSDIEALTAK